MRLDWANRRRLRGLRAPDAAQRAALAAWCAADPGPIPRALGPGSAEQHCVLHRVRDTNRLLPRLAERRAERMARIDPDNAQFPREEFQFLQRERHVLVVGMAVDIGVELGGEEI